MEQRTPKGHVTGLPFSMKTSQRLLTPIVNPRIHTCWLPRRTTNSYKDKMKHEETKRTPISALLTRRKFASRAGGRSGSAGAAAAGTTDSDFDIILGLNSLPVFLLHRRQEYNPAIWRDRRLHTPRPQPATPSFSIAKTLTFSAVGHLSETEGSPRSVVCFLSPLVLQTTAGPELQRARPGVEANQEPHGEEKKRINFARNLNRNGKSGIREKPGEQRHHHWGRETGDGIGGKHRMVFRCYSEPGAEFCPEMKLEEAIMPSTARRWMFGELSFVGKPSEERRKCVESPGATASREGTTHPQLLDQHQQRLLSSTSHSLSLRAFLLTHYNYSFLDYES
ncbi:hypothetical protein G7K_6609-t1 [Saitoella complicata NRRL Y-17804]|uniref:Uncharacterized protein n=1 Tax=Saitoella complicata (strain BCRC 22490 / CBS 7301 / JCM 7358 / NBRC 10748 / NRRL Y-17804) TaxID=698492 RepID=A0A0E9NSX5_SAICN|nr:hypothetical protein G7K_6609-t1 [Saitoella complicata NRRL Y-17804]